MRYAVNLTWDQLHELDGKRHVAAPLPSFAMMRAGSLYGATPEKQQERVRANTDWGGETLLHDA